MLSHESGPVTMREFRQQQQRDMMEYGLNGKPALFAFLPDGHSGVSIRGERPERSYDWIAIGR